jgi:DNA-binding NtrC family response regulator
MKWAKLRCPCSQAVARDTKPEIQRVGSPEIRQVNVWLIAATNRDLRAEVLGGRFREDLYYRLSSIQIRIPSLAERLEDIPLLVQYFLKKYNDAYGKNIARLTRRAQAIMLQHTWPGSVRELENVISSVCITTLSTLRIFRTSWSIAEECPAAGMIGGSCRGKK